MIRSTLCQNKGRSQLQAPAIRYLQVMHSESRRGCSYAARFLAAHLFFIAALIRLRAAGDKWRLTPPPDWAGGRPGPRFRPCKAEIAALRRSRSASNSSMIVAVSMLLLGDYECTNCTCANKALGAGCRFEAVRAAKALIGKSRRAEGSPGKVRRLIAPFPAKEST